MAVPLLKTSTQVAGAHKPTTMRDGHEKEKPSRNKHNPAAELLYLTRRSNKLFFAEPGKWGQLQVAEPSTHPHTKPPHSNIPGNGWALLQCSSTQSQEMCNLFILNHTPGTESCSLPPSQLFSKFLVVLCDQYPTTYSPCKNVFTVTCICYLKAVSCHELNLTDR